jgi:hypothetical protein
MTVAKPKIFNSDLGGREKERKCNENLVISLKEWK